MVSDQSLRSLAKVSANDNQVGDSLDVAMGPGAGNPPMAGMLVQYAEAPPHAPAPDVENQAGRGDNGEGHGQPAPPGQTNSTPGAPRTSQPDTGGGVGDMNGVVTAAGIVGRGAGGDPSSGQTTEDAG
jgi:hypothetical protein